MFTKPCEHCSVSFSSRNRSAKYCSRRCGAAVQSVMFKGANSVKFKGGAPTFTCTVCGTVFSRYMAKGAPDPIYCSKGCMTVDYRTRLVGEGNPAWRGGKWPYKGRFWAKISRAVIARDKTCVYCGGTTDLVAHHIIPQRYWLDLDAANVMSNLVACCHDCHVRRPEHYWVELPDSVFNPTIHSKLPMPRTTTALVLKPACIICGKPVKWARNQCCSYTCAQAVRWNNGCYEKIKGHRPGTIEKHTRVCAHCGKVFIDKRYMGANFCSRDCFLSAPTGTPGKGRKNRTNI